jgi:hypothetical protein
MKQVCAAGTLPTQILNSEARFTQHRDTLTVILLKWVYMDATHTRDAIFWKAC